MHELQVMTPKDFPHGLRCPDCSHIIRAGEFYAVRLTGMNGEVACGVVTCAFCARSTDA